MPQFKYVPVSLPASVQAIITAAGGDKPAMGGMPHAIAAILGAIPWIAVALSEALPPEEYQAFLGHLGRNLDQLWDVVSADDPKAEFARVFEEGRRLAQERAVKVN